MQANNVDFNVETGLETEIVMECPKCHHKNQVLFKKAVLMNAICESCEYKLIEQKQDHASEIIDVVEVEATDATLEQYELQKYEGDFSEDSFWNKLVNFAKKAGSKVVYAALLLYFAFKKESTPLKAKAIILGALGYFISPIDLIPDFIPILGYTDDLSALLGALVVIAVYIDKDCIRMAREKIRDWFGDECADDLAFVESKLNK